MSFVQIVYISRSTFPPGGSHTSIDPNVAKILTKSRVNNRRNGLVGVLYYGDGCFFQCLEGEEHAIDELYTKLLADDRHTDIQLLSRRSIPHLSFEDWAMKYVPLEDRMNKLLDANGYKSFDPYRFDDAMVEKVLELLFAANDVVFTSKPSGGELSVNNSKDEKLEDMKKLVYFSMTVSFIALALSLISIINAV